MADADTIVVHHHLQKVLSSEHMEKSEASQRLLRYLAERALRGETPKETEIAIDVFGRDASFNSAEESLVRVAVRALRRRLHDYYAGPGQQDELHFDVPKGGYRLVWTARELLPAQPQAAAAPVAENPPPVADALTPAAELPVRRPRAQWLWVWAITATVLLALSLLVNGHFWLKRTVFPVDPAAAKIARSPLWAGIIDSDRPLMLVLGDGFMYTNVDPLTGRVQLIRDRAINSSEELRIFLAQNPSIAPGRGQRYTSMLQKSTAVGMAQVLRLVSHPGRQIEVRPRDDLQVDDLQKYDIIYIGPLSRLGPLAGHYELQSRYRYDSKSAAIQDIVSGKTYLSEGELTVKHTEYALAARFVGPGGNNIVILTPGARNSGMLLAVRTLTSPASLQKLQKQLHGSGNAPSGSFEALLSLTSFGQTDVAAEILAVHPLPNTAPVSSHPGAAKPSH